MFSPTFSSRSGIDTLPSVDAMIVVLPDADGPTSFDKSTRMVRMLPSTFISTFFMQVSPDPIVGAASVGRRARAVNQTIPRAAVRGLIPHDRPAKLSSHHSQGRQPGLLSSGASAQETGGRSGPSR